MKSLFSQFFKSSLFNHVLRLAIVLVCLSYSAAAAAGDYYSKCVVGVANNSSGSGKVYAAGKTIKDKDYGSPVEGGTTVHSSTGMQHQYKISARSDNGYYFMGWNTDKNAASPSSGLLGNNLEVWSGTPVQDEKNPATIYYYAFFAPILVQSATDAAISISDFGTTGYANVTFTVTEADDVDLQDFTYTLSSGNIGFEVVESADFPKIEGNVVTIQVKYTDQNIHNADGNPKIKAELALTSKGDANSKATATITATSDLTPTFTKPDDYNFGEIYVGDQKSSDEELYVVTKNSAASQASPASQNATGAKWTASVTGTDKEAFVLSNANPEYGRCEVTFKPTKVKNGYSATLNLKVEYTDSNGKTICSTETVTQLSGSAKQAENSAIVFTPDAVDFNEQVTGYTGSQKVTVSQQNVNNVTYSFGETNADGVFSYVSIAGAVTISANPIAPGTYTATLTATGDDTRAGQTGNKTIGRLPVSVTVGLASPVLTGGSNLKDTYYLTWNTVPHASTYTIYEVSGENKTDITSTVTYVVDESDTKTVSIPANSSTQKTFVVEAKGSYRDVEYTAWSNPVTVKLSTLTIVGTPYLEIYTGTQLASLAEFPGISIPKKKVNLINTFDVNGKPLFDELYVFGETVTTDGSDVRYATASASNNIKTPCYVFVANGEGYILDRTIDNVNTTQKQLPNTSGCWNITTGNKKLYFTGFCPMGSNGYRNTDNGIIYVKGAAGTSVDIYLEDCQLYSRLHTQYGDAKSYTEMGETFTVPGFSEETRNDPAGGTASAIVVECTGNNNHTSPFCATIHTIGENILYSQLGSPGYKNLAIAEFNIGHYCASMQVRAPSNTSRTTLSFDDKWPTDVTDDSQHKRTNGMLRFRKSSTNSPSIEMGNSYTVVNFNGGQIELQNSQTASPYYLNSLAICCRLGYAEYQGIPIYVGHGLGRDMTTGTVNFNDGTVNALPFQVTAENKSFYDLDEQGYTTTIRCPENTYIMGGSHNVDIRACSAVDKTGASPTNAKGETLIKVDYLIEGTEVDIDASGLVKPNTLPDYISYGNEGKRLDLTKYGKQSLSPDAGHYLHFWAPGEGRIEYTITSWIACMPKVEAGVTGVQDVTLGGEKEVPSTGTDKVNYLMYAQLDDAMLELFSNNGYKAPAIVPGASTMQYTEVDITKSPTTKYMSILNQDSYTISENIYYIKAVTADEWMLFSPPFDVSNVYVIESYPENELVNLAQISTRANAIATQAQYNMDFASMFVTSVNNDAANGHNYSFDYHYSAYLAYASNTTNKVKTNYAEGVRKEQLQHFTGNNFSTANYYLYKSADAVWEYEDAAFKTDWQMAQPVNKMIGEHERTVIMEQGGIYALQFPYCPGCEDVDPETGLPVNRTIWDYWTGKLIVFEGYGPQVIPGSNASELIATIENPSVDESGNELPNSGALRANPVFAEYTVNTSEVPNAHFYDNISYEFEYNDPTLKPGDVFMVTNFSLTKSGMPAKGINFRTGAVTWEDDNNTTTGTPTIAGNRQMMVYTIEGGVGIIPVTAQQVSIYNAAGQLITSQYLTDEVQISLPTGIYLVSGEKDQAKVIVK